METLPWVGPVAPIIAAIVGAAIGGFVTYRFVVKRKALTIWVRESEDLTLPLKRHHHAIVFKIGDDEMFNLNRGTVQVKNTGNVSITNVRFTIVVLGTHKVALAEVSADVLNLRRDIAVEGSGGGVDPYFEVAVPYLNAREEFEIEVFFNGRTDNCKVHCRLEDVHVAIREGRSLFEEALEAKIDWSGGPRDMFGGAILYGLRTAYRVLTRFK